MTLQDFKTQQLANFEAAPKPSRKDENWRFGNLKKSNYEEFESFRAPDTNVTNAAHILPVTHLGEEQAAKFAGLLEKAGSTLGSSRVTSKALANIDSALFIDVPANTVVEKPIIIDYSVVSSAGNATLLFINGGANSQFSVIERYASADEAASATAGFTLINGEAGANVKHLALQNTNEEARISLSHRSDAAKDANVTSFILNTGAAWSRSESSAFLNEAGAHVNLLSISTPNEKQEFDQRTFQHHACAHTTSNLLYKNSLYDTAKTVFSGLIFVDEKAHFTDAYQTCRNLLMSETTEANSMPGLEINADQVKCSHGSTSATIEDEEIFYLKARGIDPKTAKQMIARGFLVEVLEELKDEALEELVLESLDQKLSVINS